MPEQISPLRLSILALAARRAIGGRIVVRATARPSEAVPAVAKRSTAKRPASTQPASKRSTAAAGRAAVEGREQMTDAARIAVLWRRGTPLRELRGEYGALADAVVRSLLPALDWRRAA